MMFLVRSAFWLSLVYAHMPLDGGETLRVVDQTRSAVIASATNAVRDKCAADAASCRAILSAAAGIALAPGVERAANTLNAPSAARRAGGQGQAKSLRPSASSLTAGDLTAPWRGKPAKSGA